MKILSVTQEPTYIIATDNGLFKKFIKSDTWEKLCDGCWKIVPASEISELNSLLEIWLFNTTNSN